LDYRTGIYLFCKRAFDFTFALIGIVFLFPPLLLIGILIKSVSKGPLLHWSCRVGINNSSFRMAKLRTMRNGTPVLSHSHLKNPERYFIPFGSFIRKTGIDELPQLYNILKGEMSFVGPRPVVFDDFETTILRNEKHLYSIKPGLTGLAQINGRGSSSISEKVLFDEVYMKNMSLYLDLKIMILTNYYLYCENIARKKTQIELTGNKVQTFLHKKSLVTEPVSD
jgi:O-antigen biosynthesis protein WbqP